MAEIIAASADPFAGLSLSDVAGVARIASAPMAARLCLRTKPETAAGLLAACQLEAPGGINTAAEAGSCAVLQLGPDEWWLLDRQQGAESLALTLAAAGSDAPRSVVDITQRHVGMVLSGAAVEDVLAAACPLPVSLDAFPVGRATRTLYAKAEIVLWRQALDTFHIEVGRSFLPYLTALVATAIREEAALRRS